MKFASGILPIAADTKKICLAWRSPDVREGNRWGVIGGMKKAGKSLEESAKIELDEEMGYSGPIELHRAFLCRLRDFEYQNFIGVVPTAFSFNPDEKFEWETSFIGWYSYKTVCEMMQEDPARFHKGMIQLFQESKELIERLSS
jgi:8-oxo-dGTP pyrophosphatase MutT (NUDIX family)